MLGTHRFHGTGLLPINEWLVFTFFFVWSLVGKYTSHMGSNLHRDTQDVYSTIPLKQVFCTRKRQWLQSAAATDLHNLQLPSFVWWFPIRMWPHHQFPLYIQGHLLRYGTLGVPKRPYPFFLSNLRRLSRSNFLPGFRRWRCTKDPGPATPHKSRPSLCLQRNSWRHRPRGKGNPGEFSGKVIDNDTAAFNNQKHGENKRTLPRGWSCETSTLTLKTSLVFSIYHPTCCGSWDIVMDGVAEDEWSTQSSQDFGGLTYQQPPVGVSTSTNGDQCSFRRHT